MGKEIVYCGGCGKSLREDEFTKGKAHTVDNRPFCTECKPIQDARPAPSQIQSSSKLSALSKVSSTRALPAVTPSTRRRKEVDLSSKAPLLIGATLVAVALIILAIFMASPGGRSPDPEPPAPPPRAAGPASAPLPPPPASDKAAAAFKGLESFAATSPTPIELLQRCDETRAAVQGTPFEARLRAIEDRAKDARRSLQVDAAFDEVKKIRAFDKDYERREEILRLLDASLPVAGPRRGEVEALIASYKKDAEAFAKKPPPPPPPGPASGAPVPYDTDARGCVNHWLVLGPFGNRTDRQGLYDADLLKTELNHVPAAGLEVPTRESTKVRWTPAVVSEGKLQFRALGPAWQSDKPAIAFAACWIVAEKEVEVKFRTSSDGGFQVILDHQRIRNLPVSQGLLGEEDVYRVKLTEGPHLVLFKVATIGAPFAVRLRVTDQFTQDRAPGVRVWSRPPVTRRLLYSETFNDGPGAFKNGELVDGGVDGTKAYAIVQQKGVTVEGPFKTPVTAETTVRVKIKPLFEVRQLHAMLWSNAKKANCWYHLPKLKKDEWTVVEFKVAHVRQGYKMEGPSLEGDLPIRLTFYHEDKNAEGRILIDDFEILE